jgi:hypothetical protein
VRTIFGNHDIEAVGDRRRKAIMLACAILFLVIAIEAWFSFIAQGVAYGDLFGVRGREGDLAQLAFHADTALGIALISEGLAVGIAFRLLLAPVEPKWARLPACFVLALLVDFATFAIVRP